MTMAFLLSSYHQWNLASANAETLSLSAMLPELSHSHHPRRPHPPRHLALVVYWILVRDLGNGPAIVSVVAFDSLKMPLLSLQICPVRQRHVGKRECGLTPPIGSQDARSEGSPLQ